MISLAGLSIGSDSSAGVTFDKKEAFGVLRNMTSPQATGKHMKISIFARELKIEFKVNGRKMKYVPGTVELSSFLRLDYGPSLLHIKFPEDGTHGGGMIMGRPTLPTTEIAGELKH